MHDLFRINAVLLQMSMVRKLRTGGPYAGASVTPPSVRTGNRQGLTNVVALDCEMVGVGPGGERSALAR